MNNDNDKNTNSEEAEFKYFKPVKRLALIFFIGFSVYLFISTMMLIFLTKSSAEVKIPDVTNKRFVDVSNGLTRKGFRTELKFVDVYDIEDGIILDQYPEGGRIALEESKITLTISRSKFFIDVPSLVGSQLPIAVNKLKNLHYQDKSVSISTGVISYIPSDKTAANVVIDQSPKAGTKISPDVKVNLLVSSGSVGVDKKMPDVTGQSIDLCYDLLLAKGVIVNQEIVKTDDINKSGLINSQSIPAETLLNDGATVTVSVNYYSLTEHPYSAYELIEYVIPSDQPQGLFEAYIEDNHSRRIRFSSPSGPGQTIKFLFQRVGNAKIFINRDKKNLRVLSIHVNEF
ncbi:MAG TPA: PASTA domain-containing protein [Spirochaetota bacterium]|nr:PASTA domain-containing protein [Spirochaetota bacterium]